MSRININFHMLPDELLQFAVDIMNHYPLSAEVEQWHPKVQIRVDAGDGIVDAVRQLDKLHRIWLIFNNEASSCDRIMINVGQRTDNCLQQSQMGADVKTPEAIKILKEIATKLRRRTTSGVWIMSESGSVGHSKSFRVSPAAARAARAGHIELKNLIFTQRILVDPPLNAEHLNGGS